LVVGEQVVSASLPISRIPKTQPARPLPDPESLPTNDQAL